MKPYIGRLSPISRHLLNTGTLGLRQMMAIDIIWERTQKHFGSNRYWPNDELMHKIYIVQRKTLAKQFETFRNNSNDLKTVSNQFAQLRKLLKMVCKPMTRISRRCMSPKSAYRRCQNEKQHAEQTWAHLWTAHLPAKLIDVAKIWRWTHLWIQYLSAGLIGVVKKLNTMQNKDDDKV